jgi:peptide methionine sulfoxide reductase MsrB
VSLASVCARFGVTEEWYWQQARKGCAICGRTRRPDEKRLALDHDHVTGMVRGVLCQACNNGLGHFQDDPERLLKAALYIETRRESESESDGTRDHQH